MRLRKTGREAFALLPWFAAALVWFGVVAPMRADEETRLASQSRIRRDRLKAERGLRETQAAKARVGSALAKACAASPDPAALRQRTVGATAGLPLSPFSLTVTGAPEAGASVDASGPSPAAMELLRRLGDPHRGGFLRTVSIRDKGSIWTVSATTGVFASLHGGLIETAASCPPVADPTPADPTSTPPAPRAIPSRRPAIPLVQPAPATSTPLIETPPAPPITLVAFLLSNGKNRVSVHVGDEIRVFAAGQTLDGWTCVSIDRDEGVVFTSPHYGRVVLKPDTPGR
jgi:hypothetical protein